MHDETLSSAREPWPLRPLLLAALGLATGLAVRAILGETWYYGPSTDGPSATQFAGAAFLTVFAGVIVFTLERVRWIWSLGFALVGAAVAALIFYGSGDPDRWSATEGWRTVSLFVSFVIGAPLFQAARDAGAARFAYRQVYDNLWTNVVLFCAGWGFTGVVFVMVFLLALLFSLSGIAVLEHLLLNDWSMFALGGASYGAGVGLFRERDPIIRLARRVLAAVLSVLAPVLGIGLLFFLLALPFTGLHALWDATKATTPILLACAIGSLALVTIVIGGEPEEEARNPALRFGAMALGLVVLPLAILAAVATGLRISQYGFTPERLWALVFVVLATICGVAYLLDIVRGRLGWAVRVRPTNLVLAFLICGAALVFATPLLSFNAISARDQVARLESGQIKPDNFDWAALAFDFGEPGKAAIRKLRSAHDPLVARLAREAGEADHRWDIVARARANERARQLRVIPAGTALPQGLQDAVVEANICAGETHCTLFLLAGGQEAMLFRDGCFGFIPDGDQEGKPGDRGAMVYRGDTYCISSERDTYNRFVVSAGKWSSAERLASPMTAAAAAKQSAAYKSGQIEVRTVEARQVFVGGAPVGDPFE